MDARDTRGRTFDSHRGPVLGVEHMNTIFRSYIYIFSGISSICMCLHCLIEKSVKVLYSNLLEKGSTLLEVDTIFLLLSVHMNIYLYICSYPHPGGTWDRMLCVGVEAFLRRRKQHAASLTCFENYYL